MKIRPGLLVAPLRPGFNGLGSFNERRAALPPGPPLATWGRAAWPHPVGGKPALAVRRQIHAPLNVVRGTWCGRRGKNYTGSGGSSASGLSFSPGSGQFCRREVQRRARFDLSISCSHSTAFFQSFDAFGRDSPRRLAPRQRMTSLHATYTGLSSGNPRSTGGIMSASLVSANDSSSRWRSIELRNTSTPASAFPSTLQACPRQSWPCSSLWSGPTWDSPGAIGGMRH